MHAANRLDNEDPKRPDGSMFKAIQLIGPGRLVWIQVSDQFASRDYAVVVRNLRWDVATAGFGSESTVSPFNRHAGDAREEVVERD